MFQVRETIGGRGDGNVEFLFENQSSAVLRLNRHGVCAYGEITHVKVENRRIRNAAMPDTVKKQCH